MRYFVLWKAGDGCAYRESEEFDTLAKALAYIHEQLQPPISTPLKDLELIEGRKLELEATRIVDSVRIKN